MRSKLPYRLAPLVAGYEWHEVHVGRSSARVYRLTQAAGATRYLKIAPRAVGRSLRDEAQRLRWLRHRLPVPEVLAYHVDSATEYLLLSALARRDASESPQGVDLHELVAELAECLCRIHGVGTDACPFDVRLDAQIAAAARRLREILIDENDFDPARRGRTAEDLYDELLATRPATEDLVFTHGDYCVPNVIVHDGAISGFVDWSAADIGDRYRDIALAIRSLTENFGAASVQPFIERGLYT